MKGCRFQFVSGATMPTERYSAGLPITLKAYWASANRSKNLFA